MQPEHKERPIRTNAQAASDDDRTAVPQSTGYGEPEPEFIGQQPNRFAGATEPPDKPNAQLTLLTANWADHPNSAIWDDLPFDEAELERCLILLYKGDVQLIDVRGPAEEDNEELMQFGYGSPLLVTFTRNGAKARLVLHPLSKEGFNL